MKSYGAILASLVVCILLAMTSAFAPRPLTQVRMSRLDRSKIYINIGEPERDKLTRDTEPQDYFRTNTDKMTDEEKLPIALAGVAFITVPFIAGLIALYAAK